VRVTLASLGCHGGLITKPHLVTHPAEGFCPPVSLPPSLPTCSCCWLLLLSLLNPTDKSQTIGKTFLHVAILFFLNTYRTDLYKYNMHMACILSLSSGANLSVAFPSMPPKCLSALRGYTLSISIYLLLLYKTTMYYVTLAIVYVRNLFVGMYDGFCRQFKAIIYSRRARSIYVYDWLMMTITWRPLAFRVFFCLSFSFIFSHFFHFCCGLIARRGTLSTFIIGGSFVILSKLDLYTSYLTVTYHIYLTIFLLSV
jgi:hypothetical protein